VFLQEQRKAESGRHHLMSTIPLLMLVLRRNTIGYTQTGAISSVMMEKYCLTPAEDLILLTFIDSGIHFPKHLAGELE